MHKVDIINLLIPFGTFLSSIFLDIFFPYFFTQVFRKLFTISKKWLHFYTSTKLKSFFLKNLKQYLQCSSIFIMKWMYFVCTCLKLYRCSFSVIKLIYRFYDFGTFYILLSELVFLRFLIASFMSLNSSMISFTEIQSSLKFESIKVLEIKTYIVFNLILIIIFCHYF